jgi:hypothetical protein
MAQQDDTPILKQHNKYDYEQIFSTNHWNFFVRPSIALTAPYHFTAPGLDFKFQSASPDVMFGWMYQFNFKKWWGIQTGIGIEPGWIRFGYLNSVAYNGIRNDGTNYTVPYNFLLSLPLYAVYRLPLYDKHNSWLLDFKLGADIRYIQSSWLEYDGYQGRPGAISFQFFHFEILHPGIVDAVFHLSVGAQYILPNKKLIEFSIIGGYAPFYTINPTYSFNTGYPREVDGSFSRTYGYLGFELNYIFTRVRHMKPAREGYTIEPIFKPKVKKNKNQSLPNIN